ncbi:MAG: hypothetical protein K6F83_06100 [Clostridiales bacterium]|nr:hypothetical protein [Clostridiales bacterium]
MYLRMLKKDITDKPVLNIVAFIFMIAAAMFMVIGSTLIYALFGGEQKTYEKCRSSDVIITMDQNIADKEGAVERFSEELDNKDVFTDHVHDEVVPVKFSNIEMIGDDIEESVHYSSKILILDVPDDYDIPIDLDNRYFEVPDGCVAVSQMLSNRFGLKMGDKVRLTTQMGNIYEYTVSQIYMNPATIQIDCMYLSDSDKESFYAECPFKYERYICKAAPDLDNYIYTIRDNCTDLFIRYEDYRASGYATRMVFLSNDGLFSIIVTCCMLVVAVAVMVTTMITIDFSLKSAIKREEREIGMMKAIGVWSMSYKTLYIVKYIFLAALGGLIGLPLGFFLSRLLFKKFVMNVMYPEFSMMIMIGLAASVVTVLLIVLFSFFALRRMNKISVIDAIHGENRGERFSALPGLSLNGKKHMPVPLFLAVSDILRSFKRYILLILAFVLGISIVLFVVRLNDTIMTTDYAHHYFQDGGMDFLIDIDDTYYDKLLSKTGSFQGAVKEINKDFRENGIPAEIKVELMNSAKMEYDGGEVAVIISWRDAPSSEIEYLEGNPPKLSNEVAVGFYDSRDRNLKIGDTVTVEYEKYTSDHTTFSKVREEFIITAIVDRFGSNNPCLYMGDDFEGSVARDSNYFSCIIDAPEDQHDEIIKKMQSLYPDGEVRILENDEIMPHYLVGYQPMFRLIISIVSIICAVVLTLLTALYENIFIDEETSDIALLKSMGFDNKVIRAWHFLRLLILALMSMALTYVFMATGGNLLIGYLFKTIMKCGSFKFKVLPLSNFVIIPLFVISSLAVVILLITRITDGIRIWKVRNE